MSSYGSYYLIDRIDLTFLDFSSEMIFKQTVKFFAFFKFWYPKYIIFSRTGFISWDNDQLYIRFKKFSDVIIGLEVIYYKKRFFISGYFIQSKNLSFKIFFYALVFIFGNGIYMHDIIVCNNSFYALAIVYV